MTSPDIHFVRITRRTLGQICELSEASPEGFYRKMGFIATGDHYGDEIELILQLGAFHPVSIAPVSGG